MKQYTVEFLAGDYQVVTHNINSPVFTTRREAEEYREYKRAKSDGKQNKDVSNIENVDE